MSAAATYNVECSEGCGTTLFGEAKADTACRACQSKRLQRERREREAIDAARREQHERTRSRTIGATR